MMRHVHTSRAGQRPRWRNLPAVLALAAVLAGCETSPPEKFANSDAKTDVSVTLMQSGNESRSRGDYAGAAILYRHAYAANPNTVAPLVALGQVLSASGEPKEAAEAFRKALATEPNNSEALRGLGNSMVAIDQPELAIGHYNRALAVTPAEPRVFNGLGVANDLMGKHKDAQDFYRAGLEVKPDDPNLKTNLGLSLVFAGEFEAGIDVLRKLATDTQATMLNRQNLALALGLAGRNRDAAKIASADLDERSVQSNIVFYETLRAMKDSVQRVRAIHARYAARQ
jgi:Flp pilus assembly protein TadD